MRKPLHLAGALIILIIDKQSDGVSGSDLAFIFKRFSSRALGLIAISPYRVFSRVRQMGGKTLCRFQRANLLLDLSA